MRTVIFDLDGTLADTSGDLIAAGNAAVIALGHAPQLQIVADDATAFLGGRAMLRLSFQRLGVVADEAAIDAGYSILLEAYAQDIDTHTTLYPGAIDAVERLLARDIRVGICTNKPAGLAETLMQRLGVRDLFGSLIGADTLAVRKPNPAPYILAVERAGGHVTQSLLIGDTATDRNTAKAAGVPSVLVTFGPNGHGVEALEPEALLHHYDTLDIVVDALLPG
ncbi:MAG: phosphoglycolate phosphatase [Paracoccaceae bacterium]|jgi:phosphoglycolate phosphatase